MENAQRIAGGLAELVEQPGTWIHRIWEDLELSDAAVLRRQTHMDVTVPVCHARSLSYGGHAGVDGTSKGWFVLPLGFAAKPDSPGVNGIAAQPADALRRFELKAPDGVLLASSDTNGLLCAMLDAELGGESGAERTDALLKIASDPDSAATQIELLVNDFDVDRATIEQISEEVLTRLSLLAVVVNVQPGVPTRVTWSQDIRFRSPSGGDLLARLGIVPLVRHVASPGASLGASSCYVTVSAPERMAVEAVAISAPNTEPIELHTDDGALPAANAAAYLPSGRDPEHRLISVAWGLQRGDLRAAAATMSALAVAVLWIAYTYREQLPTGSGSTLIAAPALLAGIVTGFSGGRAASYFAGPLRLWTLLVALPTVLAGIVLAVAGTDQQGLDMREHRLLDLAMIASVLALVPFCALLRPRMRAERFRSRLSRGHATIVEDGIPAPLLPVKTLANDLATRHADAETASG